MQPTRCISMPPLRRIQQGFVHVAEAMQSRVVRRRVHGTCTTHPVSGGEPGASQSHRGAVQSIALHLHRRERASERWDEHADDDGYREWAARAGSPSERTLHPRVADGICPRDARRGRRPGGAMSLFGGRLDLHELSKAASRAHARLESFTETLAGEVRACMCPPPTMRGRCR